MKSLLSVFWTMMLSVGIAAAQVPDAISYQGRLLDSNGTAVTGTVDVAVSLHNAQSDGMQIYNEVVGLVPVVDGIYSFYWGTAGTSVVTATEQMAVGDGVTTVYNYTTMNTPLVNPSVTISDGAYSWNDVSGSSSPGNFLGSVSDYGAGSVSAIYLSGAPDTTTVVNVAYSYTDSGVNGSLGVYPEVWLEVSLEGSPLSPRQRIVSVPYSQYSARAAIAENLVPSTSSLSKLYLFLRNTGGGGHSGLPFKGDGSASSANGINAIATVELPDGARLKRLNVALYDSQNNSFGKAAVSLKRRNRDGNEVGLGAHSTSGGWAGGETNLAVSLSEVIDNSLYGYYISIIAGSQTIFGTRVEVNEVSIDYDLDD
jgi:hypothetical protein